MLCPPESKVWTLFILCTLLHIHVQRWHGYRLQAWHLRQSHCLDLGTFWTDTHKPPKTWITESSVSSQMDLVQHLFTLINLTTWVTAHHAFWEKYRYFCTLLKCKHSHQGRMKTHSQVVLPPHSPPPVFFLAKTPSATRGSTNQRSIRPLFSFSSSPTWNIAPCATHLFLTAHAHILNLELWACVFATELCALQLQNVGALVHTCGE